MHGFEAEAAIASEATRRLMLNDRADMNDQILDRIRQRTYAYLCQVETELSYAVATERIFEGHRQRVDQFLRLVAADVLEQFSAAYRRVREGDIEARTHALTSCRRILKSVADIVCPPRSEPAMGSDGKMHDLGDAQYINRLWEFVQSSSLGDTVATSLHATAAEVGSRIEALNDLTNKGVHAEVTTQEVEWCVIQTYLLVGEVLALR
jgi:hypothetical protein